MLTDEQFAQIMTAVMSAANGAQQAAQASVQANAGARPAAGTTLLRDEGRSVDKPEHFCPKNFDEEQNRWDEWKHTFTNFMRMQDQGFVDEMHSIDQNRQDQDRYDLRGDDGRRHAEVQTPLRHALVFHPRPSPQYH